MRNFVIRRLFQAFILLFFISALIYFILNFVPGGPFDLLRASNPRVTQDHIDRLNALLGLDKPVYERYDVNDRWTVCHWHPAVQAANRETVPQFTKDFPVDVLFQDQVGARGTKWDTNPAAPGAGAYLEGIHRIARVDSASEIRTIAQARQR